MDGKQALTFVKARLHKGLPMYRLMMVDFCMPEMDGPTFTRHVRKTISKHQAKTRGSENSSLVQPHICCCTGYMDSSFKETAL